MHVSHKNSQFAMNSGYIIDQLAQNKTVIHGLLHPVNQEAHLWKPNPDKWCLLEVICHLVDEEIYDFRTRVNTALNPTDQSFVPIDPEGWVTERSYIRQNYQLKLAEWQTEREQSLDWLKSLNNPDWNSFFIHDQSGPMSAGKVLANWLAHDYLHIRQIIGIKHAYLSQLSNEDLSYAGTW
jgi:hypothetical protein